MAARKKKTAAARWERAAYLEDSLARYLALARDAEAASSYTAAIKARQEAGRVRAELDQLRQAEQIEALPDTVDAHRRALIVQVAGLRREATVQRSYVAASQLLRLEADLVSMEAQRLADEARAAEGTRTSDEVMEAIRARLDALPEVLRQRISVPGGPDGTSGSEDSE